MNEMVVYSLVAVIIVVLIGICFIQTLKLTKLRRQTNVLLIYKQELSVNIEQHKATIVLLEQAFENEQGLVSSLSANLKTTAKQLATAEKEYLLEKEKHWQTKKEAIQLENEYLRLKAALSRTS